MYTKLGGLDKYFFYRKYMCRCANLQVAKLVQFVEFHAI